MPNQDHHGLIFHWLAHEGRGLKLVVGTVATLLTLAGFALLFQVVYPAARRHPLAVQRILLLDGSTPESRAILEKVRDQDFLVLPPLAAVITPPEADPPVFTPSFKEFTLQPKDILESRTHGGVLLPRVFRAGAALLPPVAAAPVVTARPVGRSQSLQMVVEEGLSGRPVTRPVAFRDARFAEIAGTAYRIAVASSGRVTLVVPISDPGNESDLFGQIRTEFARLRFQPRTEAAVEWGTVALKWQPEKP